MLHSVPPRDPWRLPAVALWLLVFCAGLFPEPVFMALREAGGVVTQRALTNSPFFITIACALYLAIFTYGRCQRVNAPSGLAFGNSLQVLMIALLAFLPFPFELLLNLDNIMVALSRRVVIGVAAAKLLAWLYLWTLMLRYYILSNHAVFAQMHSLFPSLQASGSENSPESPQSSANPAFSRPSDDITTGNAPNDSDDCQ